MKLRYASLEGPENGVYIRGELNNTNLIQLPEYWSELVDINTVTVHLTPVKFSQHLFVESISCNKIIIGTDGPHPICCYFTVFAERKDIEKLVIEF
jgi:hypothetical protein